MKTLRSYCDRMRCLGVGIIYAAVLALSVWGAWLAQYDFGVPAETSGDVAWVLGWVVGIKLIMLYLFGQFSGGLSYFSVPDLKRVVTALVLGSGIVLVIGNMIASREMLSRGTLVADLSFSLLGVSGTRLFFRWNRERQLGTGENGASAITRVGIVGAGDAGASLAKDLMNKSGLGLQPVAFFDDAPNKLQFKVHGIPVFGPPEILLSKNAFYPKVDLVVIAMPSAPGKRIREIVSLLQGNGIRLETVPSLDQLATGKVKVSHLRPIEIGDLLGREAVELELENIRHSLEGRRVLITGAGGSIGSELSRQIINYSPQRLILVDQCEVQMFTIQQELVGKMKSCPVAPVVGDILDEARMRQVFDKYHPEVVFHAAAHKHVPLMELQPDEAIRNNTLGTARLADLSLEFDVERFVLISTDKAINPSSVMGASKRIAEMYVQALSADHEGGTRFLAVRFGNVLDSSGSVIPTFKKQIAAGGPVRVTHPEVKRYFMTIPEAVGLVLQSSAQGKGGEIFVLDMGEPVKIVELARQLIRLYGLKPDEDIGIEFIGLRPGEKMFEEILCKGENTLPTKHPNIFCLRGAPPSFDLLRSQLTVLSRTLAHGDPLEIKREIKNIVPEYQPDLNGSAWQERRATSAKANGKANSRALKLRETAEVKTLSVLKETR